MGAATQSPTQQARQQPGEITEKSKGPPHCAAGGKESKVNTTTPTQQPEALRLAEEYGPTMPHDVLHLWAKDTTAELRRQHAEIERLTAANEALRANCKPLTDEQLWANDEIMSLNADLGWHMDTIRMFARAIEAAHGIGEKP